MLGNGDNDFPISSYQTTQYTKIYIYLYNVGKNQIIYYDEHFECISDDVNQVKYITTSSSISDDNCLILPSSGHRGHLYRRMAPWLIGRLIFIPNKVLNQYIFVVIYQIVFNIYRSDNFRLLSP